MPAANLPYRDYIIACVRWNDEWHPSECGYCRTRMADYLNTHYYDIQDNRYNLVDEDVAYCSVTCAQIQVDRLIIENGPLPNCNEPVVIAVAYDTQEEATED